MENTSFLTFEELEAGLGQISRSPKDSGPLELIVRRPRVDEREVLAEAVLDPRSGLVGDSWIARGSSRTPDRSPHPEMQIALMNARVIGLVAQSKERWALAGDQLYVDLDLSVANLPVGTRLEIGPVVLEVTGQAHTGCQKFAARFGQGALAFVNDPRRKELRLRGVYAKVITPGTVKTGDFVLKVSSQ